MSERRTRTREFVERAVKRNGRPSGYRQSLAPPKILLWGLVMVLDARLLLGAVDPTALLVVLVSVATLAAGIIAARLSWRSASPRSTVAVPAMTLPAAAPSCSRAPMLMTRSMVSSGRANGGTGRPAGAPARSPRCATYLVSWPRPSR